MKQLPLAIVLAVVLNSCQKDESAKIPLHPGSFAWLMNQPAGYANNSGDTLFTSSFSEKSEYISENYIPPMLPPFTKTERFTQIFSIGTDMRYQTILLAELNNDLTRHDQVSVELLQEGHASAFMTGDAEPYYALTQAPFFDSIVLNNTVYRNVYTKSNNQNAEMFVNLEIGLVGFIFEADTFHVLE